MPWLMTAVVWATSPVRSLLLVGAAAVAAIAVALARLLHGLRTGPVATDSAPHTPVVVVPPAEPQPEPDIDWDAVVSSVRIEITNDGSVVVVGIPNTVPREYGQIIADIATHAALQHWTRTRVSRPYPSRDDRRLFTKAAKEAVRHFARTQAA